MATGRADYISLKELLLPVILVTPECHNEGCTNPAPSICASCKFVLYCSRPCQRAHWRTHKPICKKSELHEAPPVSSGAATSHSTTPTGVNNAVRILPGHFSDRESLRRLVQPFRVQSWTQNGDEEKERREIMHRFGWSTVADGGKCYDHLGTDSWYYFIYIDPAKTKRATRNEVVELVTDRREELRHEFFVRHDHGPVCGDAIFVRSGALSSIVPEEIQVEDVLDTVLYYQTHPPTTVWHERESSRSIRKTARHFGMDPSRLVYLW